MPVQRSGRRQDPGIDIGDPALPVAGRGRLAGVRRSRMSRWRAVVLVSVHAAIAAHATHFLLAGRTLSPVEPSESMYTLELGRVNAGFIFFAVAVLLTLVFGRFFCGWGCHIVALQDLCGWLMRKLGIRPRPLRSRLLAWVPLALAIYMFAWPTLLRLAGVGETSFPGWSNALVTDGFWNTFPGPVFAVLTLLTCGFAAVYFLGAKGFCTYGCPYGALFSAADRLSPTRIVVNDACEQCGHCTATCTSNVRVHEEVLRFGRVVDPGCMKCMDCVSVCPNGALSLGWARPSLLANDAEGRQRKPPRGLGVSRELLAGAVFVGAFLAFRGLYDGPPLLMSAGLAGVTAYVALKLLQLARRQDARVQQLVLRRDGRLRPAGAVFAAVGTLWLLFAAHSGFVQSQRALGRWHLDRTQAGRAEVFSGEVARHHYPPAHYEHASAAARHFALADRWGLVGVVEVKLGLAWCDLLDGRFDDAEAQVRRALALEPANARLHRELVDLLFARGRLDEAIDATRAFLASGTATTADRARLATALAERGRYPEAVEQFARCVGERPDSPELAYDFGGLLRRMGRPAEAAEQLERARVLAPRDADVRVELGLTYEALGRDSDAVRELRRAIELAPDRPESRLHLPTLIRRIEAGATDDGD